MMMYRIVRIVVGSVRSVVVVVVVGPFCSGALRSVLAEEVGVTAPSGVECTFY